jgi:hypothetical protein
MPIVTAALIAGGTALAGSAMAGSAAKSAARTSAAAQDRATEAAKFKPYNISTALGGVRFGDRTVDINYNPELAAYRDRLFGLATSELPADLEAAREAEYQRLVAGSRGALEQQTAALGTGLFRTGRQGLDIYGANPEMRAFAAAQMDRELALRQAAEQQIANRVAQSTGMFTSGVGVESALMQPLETGAQLGGRSAAAGANVMQGLMSAAQTRAQGAMVGPTLMASSLSNIGNQYMQNAQNQQMFNQLMLARSPSIYGSSNVYGPYGSGTVPTLSPNANVYDI